MTQNIKPQSAPNRLIFVYNADSGPLNMLKDWAHKILRPSTYNCQLCKLTYGNTGMRKQWHEFISHLSIDAVFLHRDEFIKEYSNLKETPLPCLLFEQNDTKSIKVILNAENMNKQESLEQLIDECTRVIETFNET